MARRFDRGEYRKPQKLENGWLRADAVISRVGVFSYVMADGSVRREFRPPEEVFHKDALSSFGLVPITNSHPPEFLSSSNTQKYAVGALGEQVRADGEFVAGTLMLTDKAAIADVEAGAKVELSCGYTCDHENTPGVFRGQKYDLIQRNIRGNHVALVTRGRAGPEARIRLDAQDAVMDDTESHEDSNPPNKEHPVKIRIDGIECEVSDQAAQLIAKVDLAHADAIKASKDEAAKAKGELDKVQAKLDSVAEELKKTDAALKEATNPEKIRAAIAHRVSLETRAREVLGEEAKLDALDEKGIKLAVLGKVLPEFKADGKSDEYVAARFDAEIERLAKEPSDGTVAARRVADAAGGTVKSSDAAREKFMQESREAWKKPLSTSKDSRS